MKIIVCVKQVPDTSGKVAVNPDGTLDRASMQTIINPDDMNAVEAALALKDQLGCPVIAVSMGPPPADGDTAQVGPQIAEKLDLPQVSYVADIKKDGNTITVKRMLEDGYMTVAVQTPCLLTCIKELNEPRYMSIRGILDCDKEPIEILDYNALKDDPLIEVDTIGLKGSPTNIYKSFTPPQKGVGMMLEGDGKDAVDQLFGILTAKHII